jgi:hypothetical protein
MVKRSSLHADERCINEKEDKSKMQWPTPPGEMSTALLAMYRFIPVKYATPVELPKRGESKKSRNSGRGR